MQTIAQIKEAGLLDFQGWTFWVPAHVATLVKVDETDGNGVEVCEIHVDHLRIRPTKRNTGRKGVRTQTWAGTKKPNGAGKS